MINQSLIRNFAIIAHIDHGKSTLSDRMLEITNTIPQGKMREQFLDQNPISRERGITIKLAPVRMEYVLEIGNLKLDIGNSGSKYILNLIDTPGHVDFSYEVSRTLAACEGVVLLVDATKGVQAQTVAHFNAAKKQNLVVIPVVNKIDMLSAQPEKTAKAMIDLFKFREDQILYVSARTGQNVDFLLKTITERIPPPQPSTNAELEDAPHGASLRALVFDAAYDQHRGVVAFVRIADGEVKKGDKIKLFQTNKESIVSEVGHFAPFLTAQDELIAGEIGYVVTGIKDIHDCNVGDTITLVQSSKFSPRGEAGKVQSLIEPLPGYKKPKPMVFFGIYPKNSDDLIPLKEALNKVALTDASLTFSDEHSAFLGNGFRVGFLGLLHAEIVKERIQQEGGIEPFLTMPQVLYEKAPDGSILEPYIYLTIYAPAANIGDIMGSCQKRKGNLINISYHELYAILEYEMPYSMFIRGLSSEIKSVSKGFASIDYEPISFKKADLINLEIKVNDVPIDVLSELVYKEDAYYLAREKTARLKDLLPRQQFKQVIQGVTGGKILAKEEIPPFRKDVLAKMSGGDRTRKDKLLDKQKKGKTKLVSISKVSIPQEALFSFYKEELK